MPLSPSDHHIAHIGSSWCNERQTARHALPPVRGSAWHPLGSCQIRGRRGEATPANSPAAAAVPGAPRKANHRAAPGLRQGSMRRRSRFSRARAAKPANPGASPSIASLRRASGVPSSMISRPSVLPGVPGSLTRSVAASANFAVSNRSIRTCQSRNTNTAISGYAEMRLERTERRDQDPRRRLLTDPAATPALLERPFFQGPFPAHDMP
jgi:hypothetical protein